MIVLSRCVSTRNVLVRSKAHASTLSSHGYSCALTNRFRRIGLNSIRYNLLISECHFAFCYNFVVGKLLVQNDDRNGLDGE